MAGILRFSSYELDPVAGELRKAGVRVPLAGQPLDVLALLLRRPGEVVTRDELKQALWPDDTFVDFDSGVNSAVRRIRRALDDSASDPRFIETLPKRGYRFVGTVAGQEAATPSSGETSAVSPAWRVWVYATGGLAVAALFVWLVARPARQEAVTAVQIHTLRPLTSLPGVEQHPSFSPDGAQVAFSWNGADRNDFDIYVQSVSGGPARRLTSGPSSDVRPVWSPDGQWIAFWRAEGDRGGVHLVSPLGGGTRKLFGDRPHVVTNSGPRFELSWSADSVWIAFVDTLVSPIRIAAVSVEGKERPLTEPAAGEIDTAPAFSPDGEQLAWKRRRGPGSAAIFTMRFADDQPVRRTRFKGDFGDALAWTPDSRSLVVERGYARRLTEIDLDRGSERDIPETTSGGQPAPSPDGARLAFAAVGQDWDVLRVDLAPGSLEPAAHEPFFASTRFEFAPQISPDGSRVALVSWRTGSRAVWTMTSDQNQPALLAERGAAPRWSPNGRLIAFDRGLKPDEGYGVWTVDADGGPAKPLTNPKDFAHQPCWSPDGGTIYFGLKEGAQSRIFKTVASGNGEATSVTSGKGERCWVRGGWVYFGRDADLMRIPESGGREEVVLEGRLFPDSGHWQVVGEWLYFIDFDEGLRAERWMLKRMDLESRSIEEVVELPRKPRQQNGLSLAPDESWFLYVVDNVNEQDLMMIEGFR